MPNFAFRTTKWALNLATRLTKADVRLHNTDVIQEDMAIIFVVNHFTRLETILFPYQLYRETGLEVWSLAAAELFVGRIGRFLRKMGTLSTKDPDRDKVIINSLLTGIHPWVIFPEGQMIKDKKVIDPAGVFSVYNRGKRRPPHRGAAALALRAEFYRHKIECLHESPNVKEFHDTLDRFNLESVQGILTKRTVVIPVNITYFPIRSRDNLVLRMAKVLAKDLSDRTLEELSVEGTFLSADTDIDITLGDPIDVRKAYLDRPEYAEVMACGDDIQKLNADPRTLFPGASTELMRHFMGMIYRLVRVNYDHIFATLIRYQGTRPFTERRYRNRIFLCVHHLHQEGKHRLHGLLAGTFRDIIFEDPSPKFHDFMKLCIREKVIRQDGDQYRRILGQKRGKSGFHAIRALETSHVIANEVEPLEGFADLVKRIARAPRKELSKEIRKIFFDEDARLFEADYEKYRTKDSHGMEVGRPFLMRPDRIKAGIVLAHGYLAAPLEVRALARYLCDRGFAVYGVRLSGHGTSSDDLAKTHWEDWYESFNRGYVVIKSLTDNIIAGGFSMGASIALMAAGLKREKLCASFAINAPLKLRRASAKLAPSVVTVNKMVKKIRGRATGWEFIENFPENAHINYKQNPLTGVMELNKCIDSMEDQLANIVAPTLVIQASKDPVVDPSSGPDIFEKIGTSLKELAIFERDRHGIINGENAEDIFERIYRFLLWALEKRLDLVAHGAGVETAEVSEVPERSPTSVPG